MAAGRTRRAAPGYRPIVDPAPRTTGSTSVPAHRVVGAIGRATGPTSRRRHRSAARRGCCSTAAAARYESVRTRRRGSRSGSAPSNSASSSAGSQRKSGRSSARSGRSRHARRPLSGPVVRVPHTRRLGQHGADRVGATLAHRLRDDQARRENGGPVRNFEPDTCSIQPARTMSRQFGRKAYASGTRQPRHRLGPARARTSAATAATARRAQGRSWTRDQHVRQHMTATRRAPLHLRAANSASTVGGLRGRAIASADR